MKREYKVIGTRIVRGARPGETLRIDLDPFAEWALIEGGHIERVKLARPASVKEKTEQKGEDSG